VCRFLDHPVCMFVCMYWNFIVRRSSQSGTVHNSQRRRERGCQVMRSQRAATCNRRHLTNLSEVIRVFNLKLNVGRVLWTGNRTPIIRGIVNRHPLSITSWQLNLFLNLNPNPTLTLPEPYPYPYLTLTLTLNKASSSKKRKTDRQITNRFNVDAILINTPTALGAHSLV